MARRSAPVNRHWTPFSSGAIGGTFAAGTVAGTISAAQHDRETLLRTRGNLMAYIDATQAPGKAVLITAGMILVPEGTGATVLWSPTTDGDAPWFWYTAFILGYEEMVTDVVDVPALTGFREIMDSKAMRRIRNQEIQLVLENTTLATAAAVNLYLAGRFLTQE